jgi:hypothetical protein
MRVGRQLAEVMDVHQPGSGRDATIAKLLGQVVASIADRLLVLSHGVAVEPGSRQCFGGPGGLHP